MQGFYTTIVRWNNIIQHQATCGIAAFGHFDPFICLLPARCSNNGSNCVAIIVHCLVKKKRGVSCDFFGKVDTQLCHGIPSAPLGRYDLLRLSPLQVVIACLNERLHPRFCQKVCAEIKQLIPDM